MGLKRGNNESEVGASSPDINAFHNSVDNKPGSSNYPLVLLRMNGSMGMFRKKPRHKGSTSCREPLSGPW